MKKIYPPLKYFDISCDGNRVVDHCYPPHGLHKDKKQLTAEIVFIKNETSARSTSQYDCHFL